MEKPTSRNKSGCPILKFKRTIVGNSSEASVVVKNDGAIPATVKIEMGSADVESEFICATSEPFQLIPLESR